MELVDFSIPFMGAVHCEAALALLLKFGKEMLFGQSYQHLLGYTEV
jgi:hypothetical protein